MMLQEFIQQCRAINLIDKDLLYEDFNGNYEKLGVAVTHLCDKLEEAMKVIEFYAQNTHTIKQGDGYFHEQGQKAREFLEGDVK